MSASGTNDATLPGIARKALTLTEEGRAELAGSLLQSLDQSIDEDAEAAWQKEVLRRVDELNPGKATTIPRDEVQRKIPMAPRAVEFHEEASREVLAAFESYVERSELAASEFAKELRRAVERIAHASGVRKFMRHRFPFLILLPRGCCQSPGAGGSACPPPSWYSETRT
jgi:putative addiction module component (TIGR02574 family)